MKQLTLVVACATLFLFQGCDTNSVEPDVRVAQEGQKAKTFEVAAPSLAADPLDFLKFGEFAICKEAPGADATDSFDFDVTIGAVTTPHSLKDGECKTVATTSGRLDVTMTELAKAGWDLRDILIYNLSDDGLNPITTHTAPGPSITGRIEKGKAGCVAVYRNDKKPTGGEGCTPGAWKNRLLRIGAWSVAGFDPAATIASVFNVDGTTHGGTTLHAGLSLQGGNSFDEKVEILLRAGIAAVLNAGHPGVDYDYSVADVVAMVNAAIATSDNNAVTTLATQLDNLNNQGCDITSGR